MAALKDALADTNAKTRRQAAEYFAAAFGDATQMCPAKTGPLLTLFCEHMLVYRGEDVLKHAKLLLAFLEDVPGMWLTYSSAELAQVFATGKMIILHTKLTQLLYKVDPSAKWWALWTLPRFARMKLVTLVDWDSGNIYRPYFDVLVARLYMFADARGSLPTGTFERLVDTAVSGNAFVADYLKRSAYAKHFDWVRKVLLQLRISVEGNNIDTAIAICKILSLSPLSQDVVSAVSTVVTSTSDFRLLKEAIGMLQTKETVGVVLQQYHRGMEMQSQSLVHFDYFLATCIATLKEVTSEPSGAEMALTHPFAKDFVLRLGCDLLEAFDLKAAYILSVFSLFAAGRKLINDCKVFPALVKHLCHAAESRDEPRVRDLLPVVRAVAWLERTLLEETDRTAIDELVSMKSHACNWESEEAGKNVFRVLEGAWVIRSTLGERFEEWKADEEGISVQNENREIGIPLVSLLPGSQERSGKNAIPSPLQIYLTHLVPRPAIVEQYNYDFNASVSASALESQSRLAAGIRICNYMKGEGISPYAVIAKWREYHYLSILPGAVALALARVEDEEKRGRTEWKLLACLMNAALASGKPLVDIAASRFCVEQNLQELILASSL